jgi:hypothetical protein
VALTNREAASLVTQALDAGHVLTVQCGNGDTLTVGRKPHAVQDGTSHWFHALRWGRSRLADPCGREVASDPTAMFIAGDVVNHCGRGSAAQAARKALGIHA